jgi:hypothetical protein
MKPVSEQSNHELTRINANQGKEKDQPQMRADVRR